jgi:hypothetical protein
MAHPPAPFVAPVSGTLEQRLAQIADAINSKASTGAVASFTTVAIGGVGGPTWTSGTAVPSAVAPVGSLYSRTTGAVGATLYVSRGGGTWNAVAGV